VLGVVALVSTVLTFLAKPPGERAARTIDLREDARTRRA
jgi:hypothetical protein